MFMSFSLIASRYRFHLKLTVWMQIFAFFGFIRLFILISLYTEYVLVNTWIIFLYRIYFLFVVWARTDEHSNCSSDFDQGLVNSKINIWKLDINKLWTGFFPCFAHLMAISSFTFSFFNRLSWQCQHQILAFVSSWFLNKWYVIPFFGSACVYVIPIAWTCLEKCELLSVIIYSILENKICAWEFHAKMNKMMLMRLYMHIQSLWIYVHHSRDN